MILVSIIIPIYNVEKFLDDTIQSVINQSYVHWELILIDDGSQDDSINIARKYLNDKRISLVLQENKGVSIARNRGLFLAKGKYIYFLDSDDSIDVNFIETSIDVAERENSNIVVVGDYFERRLPYPTALPTCAMFLRNSFLQQYPDIRFPERIQPCEDGIFSHQLLALTDKVGFNPNGVYHYRKHEHQNTATLDTEKVLMQIPKWLEILENFYQKYHLLNKKSTHLALFIEHEPYGRYLKMPFNNDQKKSLFRIVRNFYERYIEPYFEEKRKLRADFTFFLKARDIEEFEEKYPQIIGKIRRETRKLLFLSQFIPMKKIRHKKRKQYHWILEEL